MIVIDSSVWIDHLTNRVDTPAVRKMREIEDADEIIVGDIIALEVLRGARSERHAARLEAILSSFALRPMLGTPVALNAARNYRDLRAAGFTVPTLPDLVIATYCIEHGHALLTKDRDFQPFADLLGLKLL